MVYKKRKKKKKLPRDVVISSCHFYDNTLTRSVGLLSLIRLVIRKHSCTYAGACLLWVQNSLRSSTIIVCMCFEESFTFFFFKLSWCVCVLGISGGVLINKHFFFFIFPPLRSLKWKLLVLHFKYPPPIFFTSSIFLTSTNAASFLSLPPSLCVHALLCMCVRAYALLP